MLLVFLRSVAQSHPAARVAVYWQDIPARLLEGIRAVSPHADFIETAFDFAHDPITRISSKVLCWARGAEEFAGEGELVFCDSDTLVRRDVAWAFAGEGDVIFTTKPESVPLNSGVMLARGGAAAAAFFQAWCAETVRILQTPELFAQANDQSQPYGGTDQMSLHQMLGYSRDRVLYKVGSTTLRAEPCARLNETNSRPLADEICVVHYKAGWQAILLRGRPFSRFRRREDSWEMLTLFLQTLAAALGDIAAKTGSHISPTELGIAWPWYWRDGRFSAPLYTAWRLREAARRGWLLLTGRLKPGM